MEEPKKRINGLTGKALEALQKEFVVIGKTHIKAWHAWLILGLVAGIASGVLFVANRTGNFSGIFAATPQVTSTVELYLPSYLPESWRHPRKIFSGREVVVKSSDALDWTKKVYFLRKDEQKKIELKLKREKPLNNNSFVVEIPKDAPTGIHTISYFSSGIEIEVPVSVVGIESGDTVSSAQIAQTATVATDPEITFQTKICDYCYWEMVFAGHPKDPNKLFQTNGGLLSRSTDGGRTWKNEFPSAITTYPYSDMQFIGDSKFAVTNKGALFFSGLYNRFFPTLQRSVVGGMLLKGSSKGKLASSIFQEVPPNLRSDIWLVADYPKIITNKAASSVYISANAVWFEDAQTYGYGLYISRDKGKTFKRERLNYFGGAITSMARGADGTIYAAVPWVFGTADGLLRFKSFSPIAFDTIQLPGTSLFAAPRVSATSDRAWYVYRGPEILADANSASPHYGRLYNIWAQEEKVISDPTFEYQQYGYNYDIYVSYSDNRGTTWSPRARVNDDTGGGDQFFPSARVGPDGALHLVFIDHRNNPELAVYDVYYTNSRDGGASFSKNIRLSSVSAPNPYGGRSIGDYLDMVMPYANRVYAAFPCFDKNNINVTDFTNAACMAELKWRRVPAVQNILIPGEEAEEENE